MDLEKEYGKYLKGTTTIGVVCTDGVVLGSDSRATAGTFIASSEVRKVYKIDTNLGMTIAGAVGDAYELVRILKAQNELYKMNENRALSPKSATSLLSIILQQNKMMPFWVGLIIGGMDKDTPQLYNIDALGGYTDETRFTSTGSGSDAAIGYLEDAYKKMATKEAVKIVTTALQIAMRRDSATGDNMTIAIISKGGYADYFGKDAAKLIPTK